ncbi:MAG: hypothetical protein E7643_02685 [Ruminococcaceae bacterium]|nr:hypothetical protein [Oscillospiraceae bacterium]
MAYQINEQPTISSILYYYDKGNCISLNFSENFLLVLKKYGYDNITNIELGKYKIVNGLLKDYVVRYKKKELSVIDLKSEMFRWMNDDEISYISFVNKKNRSWVWDITWYKNYTMPSGISVSDYSFNHLSIVTSYERLNNKECQIKYVELFCELSDLFEAFYGRIEDVSTAVDILDRTKEKVFNPKYIQTVYWGNYFGQCCYSEREHKNISLLPDCYIKRTTKGVFFSLTDDIYDSKDHPDYNRRKKIYKHLTKYFFTASKT